mmetsp:Transcript_57153/g.121319  ORF Transcript_57153/g.121319 Transcript_57153/m.121319 type:complete len:224 (-) Transcript_57153:397-1068(-)
MVEAPPSRGPGGAGGRRGRVPERPRRAALLSLGEKSNGGPAAAHDTVPRRGRAARDAELPRPAPGALRDGGGRPRRLAAHQSALHQVQGEGGPGRGWGAAPLPPEGAGRAARGNDRRGRGRPGRRRRRRPPSAPPDDGAAGDTQARLLDPPARRAARRGVRVLLRDERGVAGGRTEADVRRRDGRAGPARQQDVRPVLLRARRAVGRRRGGRPPGPGPAAGRH